MFAPSRRSLASWRRDHGFGILCIIAPAGEHFLVETERGPGDDAGTWVRMSDREVVRHLTARGFSQVDSDDAVQLSRQWATTVSAGSQLARSSAR